MSAPDRPVTWVMKLGGSLLEPGDHAGWGPWLQLAAGQAAAGRPGVVVTGGGEFADAVRAAQRRWAFDDATAHEMAVLAMAQGAAMAQALQPALARADDARGVLAALAAGQSVLWGALDARRPAPGLPATWDETSDSLALRLAVQLGAGRLLLVKRCAIDPGQAGDLRALACAGIVDRGLAALRPPWMAVRAVSAAAGAQASEAWLDGGLGLDAG